MSLHELQNNFVTQLLNVCSNEQIQIYQKNLIGQLQKTLRQIYPVCCKLVGEEFFAVMSKKYIQIHRATSSDLSLYGESFSEFVKEFKPAESLHYLSDVARLEWAWHRIYFAPDSASFDFSLFEKISDKETIFSLLPPGSFLIQSPYPLHLIWQMNQEDSTHEIQLTNDTVYYFFIWRNLLELRIDVISERE